MQGTTWQTLNTPSTESFRGVYLYLLAGIAVFIAAFFITFAPAGKSASNERLSALPSTVEYALVAEPSG